MTKHLFFYEYLSPSPPATKELFELAVFDDYDDVITLPRLLKGYVGVILIHLEERNPRLSIGSRTSAEELWMYLRLPRCDKDLSMPTRGKGNVLSSRGTEVQVSCESKLPLFFRTHI